MADNETFFDRIYPQMSYRIDSLEREVEGLQSHFKDELREKKELLEMVEQYKKKIQRIEQFLIDRGVISLLGKELKV